MIHAVLFDLDDTLCDDTGQMLASVREVAALVGGVDPDVLGETYFRISHHYWIYELHQRPAEPLTRVRERLWQETLTSLGLPALPDDQLAHLATRYGEAREKTPPPFPDARETLTALQDRGVKLGLVTNGVSESHNGKLARLGLGHFFETILMPDLTGFAKPDPRPFHLACENLGVAPEHTAHVGDSLITDVGGAQGAGLTGVWFNPSKKQRPHESVEPHHTIHQLSELLALPQLTLPRLALPRLVPRHPLSLFSSFVGTRGGKATHPSSPLPSSRGTRIQSEGRGRGRDAKGPEGCRRDAEG